MRGRWISQRDIFCRTDLQEMIRSRMTLSAEWENEVMSWWKRIFSWETHTRNLKAGDKSLLMSDQILVASKEVQVDVFSGRVLVTA